MPSAPASSAAPRPRARQVEHAERAERQPRAGLQVIRPALPVVHGRREGEREAAEDARRRGDAEPRDERGRTGTGERQVPEAEEGDRRADREQHVEDVRWIEEPREQRPEPGHAGELIGVPREHGAAAEAAVERLVDGVEVLEQVVDLRRGGGAPAPRDRDQDGQRRQRDESGRHPAARGDAAADAGISTPSTLHCAAESRKGGWRFPRAVLFSLAGFRGVCDVSCGVLPRLRTRSRSEVFR